MTVKSASNCSLNSSSNGCITTDDCGSKQNVVPISCSGSGCNLIPNQMNVSHQMDVN